MQTILRVLCIRMSRFSFFVVLVHFFLFVHLVTLVEGLGGVVTVTVHG